MPQRATGSRLVRVLTLAVFVQWLGGSAFLPLLPTYLRHHGGSDAVVGAVMAAYFAAAVLLQYPAGRLADRVGRLPVLLGGMVVYSVGSLLFLLPAAPVVAVAFRGLQGAGAGAAEVAALAMVSQAVPLARRGRAFGSIYAGQLGGMAVGPLLGSLAGLGAMDALFVGAAVATLVACVPVVTGVPADARGGGSEQLAAGDRPPFSRMLVGALLAAGAIGLTIGVYEACWTLLLDLRHAASWEIGLSWTLFAAPFVAVSRAGGWLADHLDRRWLVVAAIVWSAAFCASYPFLHLVALLLALGGIEAFGFAVVLPSAQSLLSQSARPEQLGRAQGMYATSQTGATALSAACAGALFGVAPWVPFTVVAALSVVLAAGVAVVWRPVAGRVAHVGPPAGAATTGAGTTVVPGRTAGAGTAPQLVDAVAERADGLERRIGR